MEDFSRKTQSTEDLTQKNEKIIKYGKCRTYIFTNCL